MPTGEVVCRLYSGTSVVFVDFTLTEFVEFSNKMKRKVDELGDQVLVRRSLCTLTIPSACNLVFRRNFLKKDMIGIVPRNRFRCSDNQYIG